MNAFTSPRLSASLAAFVLWALLAAGVLYWVWRVRTPPVVDVPLAGSSADTGQADAQAVARALGAVSAHTASGAADMTGRFVLRGVVTHGPQNGAALIAVDGKPAKPVRVGASVAGADGWTLRAVTPRGAVLADGAREVSLDVPQPTANADTHFDGRENVSRPDIEVSAQSAPQPVMGGVSRGMIGGAGAPGIRPGWVREPASAQP